MYRLLKKPYLAIMVARSNFAKGQNLVQKRVKKELNAKTRGQKGPTIFSKFINSYKVI